MDNFSNTLHTNGLVNLGFLGFPFTWHNDDPNHEAIVECLDRFCATRS